MLDWQNLSAIGCKTVIQSLNPGPEVHYKLIFDDFDRYDYVNVATCDHKNSIVIGLRSDKNIGPTGYIQQGGPFGSDLDDQWSIVIGGGQRATKQRFFFLAPGKTGGRLNGIIAPNR